MSEIDKLAKTLWDYNVLNQPIKHADCIVALGNSDIRTAQRAAELFIQGYAAYLVTTGGFGRLTRGDFQKPEAQIFAEEALKLGVPSNKIVIEDKSSNTLDNLRFTQQHLEEKGISFRSVIVVTKPYMERRALATVHRLWVEKQVFVTSPELSYDTYPNEQIPKELLINMLVGDTQRVILYGERGDLQRQDVPASVRSALNELITLGYDRQLTNAEKLPR